MSTLTKEWLLKTIAELEEERDAVPGAVNEDAAMALAAMKIALASLEAEPVAYVIQDKYERQNDDPGYLSRSQVTKYVSDDDIQEHEITCTPLYTAQTAPVSVPAAYEHTEDFSEYHEGWNACRSAMLHGAEPVTTAYKLSEETGSSLQLRNLIRQRHAEWSQATFGDVGPVGPLKHLSKEALEAAEEPDDLSEWADMQFLLWDAQRRAGISDGEITAAMEEKLKVNMARQWPEPKDGEPRLHIKAAPQQEAE